MKRSTVRTAVYVTRTHGGVGGGAPRGAPLSRSLAPRNQIEVAAWGVEIPRLGRYAPSLGMTGRGHRAMAQEGDNSQFAIRNGGGVGERPTEVQL